MKPLSAALSPEYVKMYDVQSLTSIVVRPNDKAAARTMRSRRVKAAVDKILRPETATEAKRKVVTPPLCAQKAVSRASAEGEREGRPERTGPNWGWPGRHPRSWRGCQRG